MVMHTEKNLMNQNVFSDSTIYEIEHSTATYLRIFNSQKNSYLIMYFTKVLYYPYKIQCF